MQPESFALLFTVAMLAVTAYFLLGSIPLLVLRHDNPMDARFIRSFYITYYRIALSPPWPPPPATHGPGAPRLPRARPRSPS